MNEVSTKGMKEAHVLEACVGQQMEQSLETRAWQVCGKDCFLVFFLLFILEYSWFCVSLSYTYEEPEIKLPIPAESSKKQEFQKNIYFCFIDYAQAFDCVDHNKRWEILQEMGIPDHLTCLMRNLYTGQNATIRTGHGTDCFQIGKGLRQGCILSPCLLNLYAEYITWNAGLDEYKLESRLWGEISITSDMQITPPLWQKTKKN